MKTPCEPRPDLFRTPLQKSFYHNHHDIIGENILLSLRSNLMFFFAKFRRNIIILFLLFLSCITPSQALEKINQIDFLPSAQWQKTANFPNWLGRVDDTLALNSMVSFHFWHSQGKIYIKISDRVKKFTQ